MDLKQLLALYRAMVYVSSQNGGKAEERLRLGLSYSNRSAPAVASNRNPKRKRGSNSHKAADSQLSLAYASGYYANTPTLDRSLAGRG